MRQMKKQSTTKNFWKGKRVLVTGGTGFVGSHLTELLVTSGAYITVIGRETGDHPGFLDLKHSAVSYHRVDLMRLSKPLTDLFMGQDIVFHLAARVAGIGYNVAHPATMLRDNLTLTHTTLEATRLGGVKRFQFVSSACVYPRHCTIPTPETEGFVGDPEPTNYGYGWAKRMGEVLTKTYAEEFHFEVSIVRPYNGYGPRDNFDPETSHVIPALIKRVIGGEDPVIVWGDGSSTRSFLYVEDFARGILEACEKYPVADPINIGSQEEISIKELVALIIEISGSKAGVRFDRSKPNGQPRRNCDTRKATEKIGFMARVPLREGLKETIEWYRKSLKLKMKNE